MLISLTRWSLAHPLLATTIIAAITVGFALGIPRVQRETTVRTFLGADHEAVRRLDDHIATFGGSYPVIIAYSCNESSNCSSIFDESALNMAAGVAGALARVYGVRAVHSPATTPLLLTKDGDLVVQRLLPEDPEEMPDRKTLAAMAAADPRWRRTLSGPDGIVGAIVVDVASSESKVQESVAKALTEILAPYEKRGWTYYLVGELVDFAFSGRELERASQAMVPAMTALLACVLFVLLRSAALAFVTVGAMGLAYVWTQGAMGWTGIKINAVTSVTPSLVFAVGILDGVHLVTQYTSGCWKQGARSLRERKQIMVSAVEDVGRACLFTSLTTIAAFLSFAASGIASFAQFGIAASWGVLSALVITFSLVPVVLVQVPGNSLSSPQTQDSWDALIDFILTAVRTRRTSILGITCLLTILSVIGLAKLKIDIRPEQLMGEMNQVTRWSRWVRENLREIETLEIALIIPAGMNHDGSDVIAILEDLCQWLNANVHGINNARSIADVVDTTSAGVRVVPPSTFPVEANRKKLSGLDPLQPAVEIDMIDRWAKRGRGGRGEHGAETLRISAEARSMSTRDQERVIRIVREHLDRALPAKWRYYLTGSIPTYLEMMKSLQRYQLLCIGLAAISCLGLMSILLRSFRVSILGLLPSVLPAIVALGLLGWWEWGLDPASTMVATIILGVAVDDSIHLLSTIQRRIAQGASLVNAVCGSIRHLGRAVIVSSVVLAAAFWTLTISPSSSVATFGFLAGISIFVALVADLFVLPSLILRLWDCGASRRQSQKVLASS